MFGAVNLTKNANFDKYKFSWYGIGIYTHGSVSLFDGSGFGKNVIIFGANICACWQKNKNKKIKKIY